MIRSNYRYGKTSTSVLREKTGRQIIDCVGRQVYWLAARDPSGGSWGAVGHGENYRYSFCLPERVISGHWVPIENQMHEKETQRHTPSIIASESGLKTLPANGQKMSLR